MDTQSGPNGDTVDFNYDAVDRPSSTTSPYGAVTTYTYRNTAPQVKATTGTKWTRQHKDGFGRTVMAETGYTQSGSDTVVSVVDTEYEPCACTPMGKVKRVSRPHAPGGVQLWTEYEYDELGRVTKVKPPANSGTGFGTPTTYVYGTNTVTVTEPGGRWKQFASDAFGNLTKVVEPRPGGGPTYQTTYQYTPLNQLSTVTMTRDGVTQTRTFTYNGSKLASTTFPENGTTTYSYNADWQLSQKIDAKGQKITYEYDTNKRLKYVKRFPVGMPLGDPNQQTTYHYDTNPFDAAMNVYTAGRLAAVEYWTPVVGPVREGYEYHQGGGITLKRMDQSATSWKLESEYTYDNEGRLVTTTYPNGGKTYTTTYDVAGRPSGMTHQEIVNELPVTVNDASGVAYNPAGQMTALTYRVEGFDYVDGFTYNNRGQLTNLATSKTPVGYFNYTQMANHTYVYPSANAGRIDSMTRQMWNDAGTQIVNETVTYQYDTLSRLTAANAQQWTQTYTYDGFGNMYNKVGTGLAPSWDGTSGLVSGKNQIGAHDANGNPAGLSFDVENRLTGQSIYLFGYAPDNKRVVRAKSIGVGEYEKEIHFYSGNNQLGRYRITLVDSTWQVTTIREERYFAGRRLMAQDRLGSAAESRLLPYGDDISPTVPVIDKVKFASYYRDPNGYDYADQRYYGSTGGRFLTVDPSISANVRDPLSWNMYAYVNSDPINHNDPRGLVPCGSEVRVLADGTFRMDVFDCIVMTAGGFAVNASSGSPDNGAPALQQVHESGGCSLSDGSSCYPEGWTQVLDGIQNVLGLAGLVPGAGEVADLLNASISLGRGDTTGGLLSLAAMLPVGGQAFEAARSIRAGLKAFSGIEKVGSHAHHVFPWALRDRFHQRFQVNVSDARFGAWWEAKDHLRNSGAYQRDWEDWLTTNPNASFDDALGFAKGLAKKYGFDFNP